jgi:hypothetical protein
MQISAFTNSTFSALAACFFGIIWLAAWWRVRHTHMLIVAAGWAVICAGWMVSAIANGPNPYMPLDDARPYIRGCLFVGTVLLVCGKLGMLFLVYKMNLKKANGATAEDAC